MAHYLAELIEKANSASDDDRASKMDRVRDTILKFWAHRYQLPNGKRPFEKIEPILRALESLDPENEIPRYFGAIRQASRPTQNETEAQRWLRMAEEFDHAARILIRYCLAQAAKGAADQSQEWVKAAGEAGLDDLDLPIIRVILPKVI